MGFVSSYFDLDDKYYKLFNTMGLITWFHKFNVGDPFVASMKFYKLIPFFELTKIVNCGVK